MTQKWNFWRGGGLNLKKRFVGGVWKFSGTTHLINCFSFSQQQHMLIGKTQTSTLLTRQVSVHHYIIHVAQV